MSRVAWLTAALLAGCAASETPAPTPRLAPAPTASAAAPEPPSPPVSVVQRLPSLDRARLALSEDGALLAVFDGTLALVSTVDGTVRGIFPDCVADAAFSLDSASMLVVGCPDRGLPPSETLRTSAPAKVWRWDLVRDQATELAQGPFEHVRAMTTPDEALVWGRDRVAIASLRGGTLRTTLIASGTKMNEIHEVSRSGTRAKVWVDNETGLLDERGFRKGFYGTLSPELDLEAENRGPRLEVKRTSDDASVFSVEVTGLADILGFDPRGERLAVTLDDKLERKVALVDRGGKVVCTVPAAPLLTARALAWSRDGERLFIRGSTDSVIRTSDCKQVQSPSLAVGDHFAANGALDVAGLSEENHTFQLPFLPSGGEAARAVRVATVEPARFDGLFNDLALLRFPGTYGLAFDPRTNRTVEEPTNANVELVSGALYAKDSLGQFKAVLGGEPLPFDAVELALIDSAGKTTKLAGSPKELQGYGSGCEASPDRKRLLCWYASKAELVESLVWDARGKLVGTWKETTIDFSRDGSRLLAKEFARVRLLDATSMREIRSEKRESLSSVRFSPDGSLVAWGAVGVVDAKSGAKLWGDAGTFSGGFLPGDPPRVVTQEGGMRGRISIHDARAGSLVHAFDTATRVVDFTSDGSRLLTRDTADNVFVFDAVKNRELTTLGRAVKAVLTADGQFSVSASAFGLAVQRIADGALIFFVPTPDKGAFGLAYTRDGLFDGGHGALAAVRLREGSVRDGKLREPTASDPGYRPGLVDDFWAGKPLAR